MSILTQRLKIQPLATDDADFIFDLLNTAGWIKFIGDRNILTQDDALKYILKILDNTNVTYWKVDLQENGTTIGIITLIKRDYLEHCDLGFAFLPNFEKKGYAFEASQAIIKYLVETKNIQTILAITMPENPKSIKLLTKLEFMFDKTIEHELEMLELYRFQN